MSHEDRVAEEGPELVGAFGERRRIGDVGGRDATGVMSAGGNFEVSALVMPATVDHIREISEHAERMPAKSTYFYPKLLGGMVVNPLE